MDPIVILAFMGILLTFIGIVFSVYFQDKEDTSYGNQLRICEDNRTMLQKDLDICLSKN
jgi:hypothetical protein